MESEKKAARVEIFFMRPESSAISTFAITYQGRISVLDFEIFEDEDGHYIEYGSTYEKIYIDDVQEEFN